MNNNFSTYYSELNRKLKISIIINLCFTIFEGTIGFWIGSLALISDASHNLTDVMSLTISFIARKIAQKDPTHDKTYGYGRATIVAALINGILLLSLSVYIFHEAYIRFHHPEPLQGGLVMVIGLCGILVNGSIALLFINHRADIAIRSAFLNMVYDAIASAGALLAGLLILITKNSIADPIISVIIACMLLFSGIRIIKEVIHIFLEGVPSNISIDQIKEAILNTEGVKGFDDLHIWAISSFESALTCHIIIDKSDLHNSIDLVDNLRQKLAKDFYINHVTIEVQLQSCGTSHCSLYKK